MRTVAWLDALRGGRPPPRWAGPAVLALSAVLFAVVVALRMAVEDAGSAVLVLLALPVTLLAVSFGAWAGLLGALAAIGAVAAYDLSGGAVGGPLGYASRGGMVLLLGLLTGWFSDRQRTTQQAQWAAHRDLQQARDELEEAQRVARVGSWRWDARTDALHWSDQTYRVFGLDPARPITTGEALRRLWSEDDVRVWTAAQEQAARDGRPFEVLQRLPRPGGGVQQVLSRAEPLLEDGVLVAVRGTSQDVTALREAQEQERAAQERLSRVLETLLDGVTVARAVRDDEGRIVDFRLEYANSSAGALFGFDPDEVVGTCWSGLWPSRMGTPLFDAYVRTVETGEPLFLADQPNEVLGAVGAPFGAVDLRAARLDDGYVSAARDVTERVFADRALAEAAAQFAAAFDHAPVGMALLRPDGTLLRGNEALAAITGHSLAELAGLPLDELVDARDVESSRALLLGLVSAPHGSTAREELRLASVGGESRWVSFSGALVGDGVSAYVVAHVEDIHERKRYEGRMQYLADHDALTGLYNRRRFHEELEHHCALGSRYGAPGVVALIDLDNFKYINDTLGHHTGDRLIQAIGRMLHSRLRDSDVVGRLGGDEFAVLLPGADVDQALDITTALLTGIRSTEVEEAGHRVRSTGSAGVARLDEPGVLGADDVLANADLAMYAAKDAGRDVAVAYDSEGPHVARSRARFRWLDRIRQALDQDLFVLQAQPILELSSGRITACEVLLRMREGGQLVQPDRFLYIAERHGLAAAVDRVVVAKCIDLAATQPRPPGFRWEVNLSAESLGDPALPLLIERRLEETGVPPTALVFEITETAAITNMDQARVFASRVRDLGCCFALDDFGAGYGSFYYLKHLPFDYLKIDGEFVRQLATSEVDRVIVRSIVASARPLGKQTIAEYVGDAETLALLQEYGVDHAQGYFVGRPVDPTAPLAAPAQRVAP